MGVEGFTLEKAEMYPGYKEEMEREARENNYGGARIDIDEGFKMMEERKRRKN
jgi:hypothetical protein